MTRYLCWVAVLGVAALPDWASACRPRWGRPVVYVPPPCPVYLPPPAYACPPAPCPAPVYVVPPPRVDPAPRAAAPPPAAPAAPRPSRPPVVEPVRPTWGSDTTRPPVAPAGKTDPAAEAPKDLIPKLVVPEVPDFRPVPKPPAPGAAAVPSPAPAPPDPLRPPAGGLTIPDPKRPSDLPSLTLPPDSPVAPGKDSTSRSSPLTGGPRVGVYPAAGAGKTGPGYRTVGFYNHTAADLDLTIEGRAVKLPAKTYLYAQLGPTFTWNVGGRPAARETVPDGAAGLDVVFRE